MKIIQNKHKIVWQENSHTSERPGFCLKLKVIAGKISKSNKAISMGKSDSNILEEIIIPESEILMPKQG